MDKEDNVMYEKLGLRDRLLISFFGWVTGIRLLNPPEYVLTEEERVIRKVKHSSIEKESDYTNVSMAEVGVSLH